MTPTPKPRKRNPQDATRRRDVAPLRRRIDMLEQVVRMLAERVEALELSRRRSAGGWHA